MKNVVIGMVALVALVIACPAFAQDGAVSSDSLQALGLGGLEIPLLEGGHAFVPAGESRRADHQKGDDRDD